MTDTTSTPASIETVVATHSAPEPTPAPVPLEERKFSDLESMSDDDMELLLTEGTSTDETPTPAQVDFAPPAPAETPTGDDDETLEVDPKTGQPVMVPIARLNQEIKKRRTAESKAQENERALAYTAGKVDALTEKAVPSTPVPDEAGIRADIRKLDSNLESAIDALATKFDSGEITGVVWKQQERALYKAAERIREGLNGLLQETVKKKNTPTAQAVDERVNSYQPLADKTAEIVAQNPWISGLNERQLSRLTQQAVQELERQGITPPSLDMPIESHVEYTLDLRLALVDVGKDLGLDKTAQSPQPATPPAPTVLPSQLKAKLALSKQQPPVPTTSGVGLPVDAHAAITDSIDFDTLANMPDSQLDAILERETRIKQA